MSTWAVYQPRSAKQSICGAGVYHQRGIAVCQQQLTAKAEALLDETAMSTWAVSPPRTAKQKHLWRRCISPARYSCTSTATKTSSKSAPGRHRRVDQDGMSTARAVLSTAMKTEAKALLVDRAVSTWAVYQPQSAKRNHLWRSCISPARYSCISTAIKS